MTWTFNIELDFTSLDNAVARYLDLKTEFGMYHPSTRAARIEIDSARAQLDQERYRQTLDDVQRRGWRLASFYGSPTPVG